VDGKLLGDLGEVGPADKANDGLLANLLEEVEHLGRRSLWRRTSNRICISTHARHRIIQGQQRLQLTRRAGVRVPSTSVCIDTRHVHEVALVRSWEEATNEGGAHQRGR
jgi:hypothetical protein